MPRGKNINLFLMDGEATGRIKCTLANWTGIAYKVPRTLIEKSKNIKYLNQTGVYFLFGNSDDFENKPVVYIGQAGIRKNGNGILSRIEEHKRDDGKDYWTEIVAFTTSNNSFGPTEISYLENRFYNMAKEANRYEIKNGNDPNPGNITEEKESELEEFIAYSKLIMGALSYKVFNPLISSKDKKDKEENENIDEEVEIFYINRNGTNAKAKRTSEGIVLLKGSKISLTELPSCRDYLRDQRNKSFNKLGEVDKKGVLLVDKLFKTPSGAACFVIGGSANGWIEWKTEEGMTLKELDQTS